MMSDVVSLHHHLTWFSSSNDADDAADDDADGETCADQLWVNHG